MSTDDLWRLDATGQAALVRAGEVTPLELLDAAIARIESLNPRINGVITPLYELARTQAAERQPDAPFDGVPMLLKDAGIEVEGTPYYVGSRVLRDMGHRSSRTTELARRLRRAGFVFVGKTNCPEFSSGVTTEPSAFGPTRNPWDLERTAGGSSGGSAAAVAAGMTSIAHGGDATGSLRYPAAVCGVATLKPSRGRVPNNTPFDLPDAGGVWADFVLARSVRDLAGVLDAVSAPQAGARFALPPERPYVEAIALPPRRLRVGILTKDVMAGIPVHAECVTAVEKTGKLLQSLGHNVDESHPAALHGLFLQLSAMMALTLINRYLGLCALEKIAGRAITQGDVDEPIVTRAQAAKLSALDYIDAGETLNAAMRPIHDWWSGGYDILVTPTTRQPAWKLGSKGGAIDAGVFSPPFSFTGQPAVSLPLHMTPAGLPVGVQLVAAYGREDLLLAVSAQLEAAAPWAARWPGVPDAP